MYEEITVVDVINEELGITSEYTYIKYVDENNSEFIIPADENNSDYQAYLASLEEE